MCHYVYNIYFLKWNAAALVSIFETDSLTAFLAKCIICLVPLERLTHCLAIMFPLLTQYKKKTCLCPVLLFLQWRSKLSILMRLQSLIIELVKGRAWYRHSVSFSSCAFYLISVPSYLSFSCTKCALCYHRIVGRNDWTAQMENTNVGISYSSFNLTFFCHALNFIHLHDSET